MGGVSHVDHQLLGTTGLRVSPVGFGAFKIGRNVGIKYPDDYALPDEDAVYGLVNGVINLGINFLDTAPAYGTSEERLGLALEGRRHEVVLCTKAGETFASGRSSFDFSEAGIRASVHRSLERLRTDVIDLLLVHSDGNDQHVLEHTDAPATMVALREEGLARAVGFSGKTVDGARAAFAWSDAIMVEYHLEDVAHEDVIAEAHGRGIGVLVKKGLASGRLPPPDAIRFVLGNPAVTSMVIGGLSRDHLAENVRVAKSVRA
ncbi:MAG: aldo/keto reductase [Planctomycetes bacterium]|nr:aldo/keto reductase [Planctomycetota bacterium]